jgi:hypothetical protein
LRVERAWWVVRAPATTFSKDDGRGAWPSYGMEVGEFLKPHWIIAHGSPWRASCYRLGRRRRGGDTAAMYLLSGADMTATALFRAYRGAPASILLARNTTRSYTRSRTNAIAMTREQRMKQGSTDLHTKEQSGCDECRCITNLRMMRDVRRRKDNSSSLSLMLLKVPV